MGHKSPSRSDEAISLRVQCVHDVDILYLYILDIGKLILYLACPFFEPAVPGYTTPSCPKPHTASVLWSLAGTTGILVAQRILDKVGDKLPRVVPRRG